MCYAVDGRKNVAVVEPHKTGAHNEHLLEHM